MKLRCVTDSIRIRVRKSDIAILKEKSELFNNINFPEGLKFAFGLRITEDQDSAFFKNDKIVVQLNRRRTIKWFESEEVSYSFKVENSGSEYIAVLIEKDFPCKHTKEDFEDTFHELQPKEFSMMK